MSILLSAHNVEKQFGARTLFKGLTFAVQERDRIGLVGPNGAGKSTLMRILAGKIAADAGDVAPSRGLSIAYLEQSPSFEAGLTVREAVCEGLRDPHDSADLMLAEELLARLELNEGPGAEALVSSLSGGWRKRAALARELARRPGLMLLDEPTNHLDVESIEWLEDFLAAAPFASVVVTHDRLFLQRTAQRIFDLDPSLPGGLLTVDGSYADYLEAKQNAMDAQARHEDVARNQLRRETEWLRRGAKARQTKQKARIERAADLKDETEALRSRNQVRTARLDFQEAERNPQILIQAKGVAKSFAGRPIFEGLDLTIGPKTRLGLIGANGAGKSTLIRVLLGEEPPDEGVVRRADGLIPAWFEQHRGEGGSIDPQASVLRAICPDGDSVQFRGQAVYGRSYLSRFLFRSEQMDMPVAKLSGGELARLRIAQLMLRPSNVLVMDEPTNDLDAATLDVLEEQLRDFSGAVILVAHDRYFLDQVSNQILAFAWNADGRPRLERFADFGQWERWAAERPRNERRPPGERRGGDAWPGGEGEALASTAQRTPGQRTPGQKGPLGRRLSYKEKLELEGMEARILATEDRVAVLSAESDKPENASNAAKLEALHRDLASAQSEVEKLYARWAELEAKLEGK